MRVRSVEDPDVPLLLDNGVAGIVFPDVNNAAEARRAVDRCMVVRGKPRCTDHDRRTGSDRRSEMRLDRRRRGEIDENIGGACQRIGIVAGVDPAGNHRALFVGDLRDDPAHPPRAAVDADRAHCRLPKFTDRHTLRTAARS